jgi:hypothetical protein
VINPEVQPIARTEHLLIQEMDQEILVYDEATNRAHCLDAQSAKIWRACDGTRTMEAIAAAVRTDPHQPLEVDTIRIGLDALGKAGLLQKESSSALRLPGETRRQLLRQLATAGLTLLIPVVRSLVAPTAAEAASMTTSWACQNTNKTAIGKCCSNNHRICKFNGQCNGSAC